MGFAFGKIHMEVISRPWFKPVTASHLCSTTKWCWHAYIGIPPRKNSSNKFRLPRSVILVNAVTAPILWHESSYVTFLGTGCLVPDIGNIYLVWKDHCMGYCVCIYPPAYDVSAYKITIRKPDWTSYNGPHLYQFIYLTKKNQQEHSSISNWFSLRCVGRDIPIALCIVVPF